MQKIPIFVHINRNVTTFSEKSKFNMVNFAPKLLKITSFADSVEKIRSIYIESFPPDERRDFDDIVALDHDSTSPLELFVISDSGNSILGMLTWWNLGDFIYIEHFAIDAQYRNMGIGTKALEAFMRQSSQPIIIEVEPPTTAVAQKRIDFYSRLGFELIGYNYIQPPYAPHLQAVPLRLMASTDTDLQPQSIANHLYKTVYKAPVS